MNYKLEILLPDDCKKIQEALQDRWPGKLREYNKILGPVCHDKNCFNTPFGEISSNSPWVIDSSENSYLVAATAPVMGMRSFIFRFNNRLYHVITEPHKEDLLLGFEEVKNTGDRKELQNYFLEAVRILTDFDHMMNFKDEV